MTLKKGRSADLWDPQFKVFVGDDGKPTGEVQYYASVYGNVDLVGDRVMPGAFDKSITTWQKSGNPIPIVFSHKWDDPFAIIGSAYAKDIVSDDHGLLVKGRLDIETNPTAMQVALLMKSRQLTQASFSYDVIDESRSKDGANNLNVLEILETGPCLKGANPLTDTVSAKSRSMKQVLIGSEEEKRALVGYAVAEQFGSKDTFTFIEGTYPDHVIVSINSMDGTPQKYMKVPFAFGPEGSAVLGQESGVTLETEVTAPDEAEVDAAKADEPTENKVDESDGGKADTPAPEGDGDGKAETTVDVDLTIGEITIKSADGTPLFSGTFSEAAEPDGEKAGRRNSNRDQAALQAAHDQLVEAGAVCSTVEESPAEAAEDSVEVSAEVKMPDYLALAKDFAELGDTEAELNMLAKHAARKLAAKAEQKSPPWHIEENGDKFDVVVNETDEVVGTHDTRQEAEDHLAALYANAKDEEPDGEKAAAELGPIESGPNDGSIVKPDEQGVECPQCGGSGKVPDGTGEKDCPKCDGTGRIPKKPANGETDAVPGKTDEKSEVANGDADAEGKTDEPDTAKVEDPAEAKARRAAEFAELEALLKS